MMDKAYHVAYRLANREKRREYTRRYHREHPSYQKDRVRNRRDFIRQQKMGKTCELCGEDDVTKLVFHHRDPSTKLFGLSTTGHSDQAILDEVAKCVVWCKTCHDTYHRELRKGEQN